MKDTFLCPKCQSPNLKGALDCSFCGIVFTKYSVKQPNVNEHEQHRKDRSQFSKPHKISQPVQKVNANSQMQKLWQQVMKEYSNLNIHELFINKAIQTNSLTYAAEQYRNILESNPHEEIALKMQDRITHLAITVFTPEQTLESKGFHFGISGLIIVLGIMIWLGAYLLSDLLIRLSFNPRYAQAAGAVMIIAGAVYRFLKKGL